MTAHGKSRRTVIYVDHSPVLGGASKLLLGYLSSLPAHGVEPVIVCRSDSPLLARCEEQGYLVHKASLPLLTVQAGPLLWLSYGWALLSTTIVLSVLARKYKASHLHANGFIAALFCVGAAVISRTPCLWHMHDILAIGTVNRLFVRFAAWGADGIICVSQSVKNRLVEFGVDENKCRVISNFLVPPLGVPAVSSLRAATGFPANGSIVGMVGNICEMKGQKVFLEAIREIADRHPNTFYVMIGDILSENDRPYKDDVLRAIREYKLEMKVFLTGYRDDAFWLIREMDLLVHPTTAPEAFGLVLAEAMYHERPVVASRTGGISEIVADGVNGMLVPPNDTAALARAIEALLNDPAVRSRMGAAGKRMVAKAFRLDLFLERLLGLYEETAA